MYQLPEVNISLRYRPFLASASAGNSTRLDFVCSLDGALAAESSLGVIEETDWVPIIRPELGLEENIRVGKENPQEIILSTVRKLNLIPE